MTPEAAIEYLERWHEFYLLAGTAAVTLVGLLFVALSFNLDVLIHDTREHLLRHARATLLSFVYVLVLSLMFLVPSQGVRLLSISAGTLSLIFMVMQWRFSRMPRGVTVGPGERFLARRNRVLGIAYLLSTVNFAAMFVTFSPLFAYNMIGIVCAVLGNAAGTSWDLLVEVGRLKRATEDAPGR